MNPEYKAIIEITIIELLRLQAKGVPNAWQVYEDWCKECNIEFTRFRDEFSFNNSEDLLAFKIRFSKEAIVV